MHIINNGHNSDVIVINETDYSSFYRRIYSNESLSFRYSKFPHLLPEAVYHKVGDENVTNYYILGSSNNVDSICQRFEKPFIYLSPKFDRWWIPTTASGITCNDTTGNDTITYLSCQYNRNADLFKIIFMNESDDDDNFDVKGYLYTCPTLNYFIDLNPVSIYVKQPILQQKQTLVFFYKWVQNGNSFMSLSINSLFEHRFIRYKNIEKISVNFCINSQGHNLVAGGFIDENNFRYGTNYRLLIKNVSPFVFYGTISIGQNSHLTCALYLHEDDYEFNQ